MLVGQIADNLLEKPEYTHARNQVHRILNNSNLSEAAIWADCAKGIQPSRGFIYAPNPKYHDHRCAIYENPASEEKMKDYVRANNDNCLYSGKALNCHKAFHFADVTIQEDHYDENFVGTNDSDVVHAILAAIAVLRGEPSPSPFHIANKKLALRLLVHFIGDLHQPLHVGAVYLDSDGNIINPDLSGFDPASSNEGGNGLTTHSSNLHHEWDAINTSFSSVDNVARFTEAAYEVPGPAGKIDDAIVVWASESIMASRQAYSGIVFRKKSGKTWQITFDDRQKYLSDKRSIQEDQIVKAGAHLAQILRAIWP